MISNLKIGNDYIAVKGGEKKNGLDVLQSFGIDTIIDWPTI
jgi:hypothetical protein